LLVLGIDQREDARDVIVDPWPQLRIATRRRNKLPPRDWERFHRSVGSTKPARTKTGLWRTLRAGTAPCSRRSPH